MTDYKKDFPLLAESDIADHIRFIETKITPLA